MSRVRRQLLSGLLAAAFLLLFFYFPRDHLRHEDSDQLPAEPSATLTIPDGPLKDEVDPDFLWRKLPVRNPFMFMHPLPTAVPQKLPKIQAKPSRVSRVTLWFQRNRREAVKDAFVRCWKSYQSLAWTTDELGPISGLPKNDLGGWGATLVDNLDTLWIMGMRKEFDDAVAAVSQINFEDTSAAEINTHETNIRYLGGLLAAYDLSDDRRLLLKAIDVGDMLYAAFDTPNRMPITRWDIHKSARQEEQLAEESALVAELGSFILEFTRLTQLTNDPKYFDAAQRVMAKFDEQQDSTTLAGMWPAVLNAQQGIFKGDDYTLDVEAESLYGSLPKAHALLGGQIPMYRSMYEKSTRTIAGHTLFRPMNPGGQDILLSGTVHVLTTQNGRPRTHLESLTHQRACSAAGMFALGAALFDIPIHLKIAQKLVDGCVWAYHSMERGIMPEVIETVPCASQTSCPWNEWHWKQEVWKKANKDPQPDFDVDAFIEENSLPKGIIDIPDARYNLRPQAIESIFLLYRITGREDLLDTAWDMFQAVQKNTRTDKGNAVLVDVTAQDENLQRENSMESFWMAQTLKYFYLMFSASDVLSLDEYVFSSGGHPLKRPEQF